MQIDELSPDGAEGQPQVEVDPPAVDEAPATVSPLEAIAAEKGWVPKEQWRGDGEWRPAEDFIRYGLERAREGKDEIRALKQTVDRIARTSEAIERRNIADAVAQAEERFKAAVEEGDTEGAARASRDIHAAQTAPPSVGDPVRDFQQRNSWFNTDPEATAYAISVAGMNSGLSADQQVAKAEEAVRKRFPELFGDTPKPREPAKQPAAVSAPVARSAPAVGRAKGFGDLPREAQEVGRSFLAKGRIKTLDDYAKAYYEENA